MTEWVADIRVVDGAGTWHVHLKALDKAGAQAEADDLVARSPVEARLVKVWSVKEALKPGPIQLRSD